MYETLLIKKKKKISLRHRGVKLFWTKVGL